MVGAEVPYDEIIGPHHHHPESVNHMEMTRRIQQEQVTRASAKARRKRKKKKIERFSASSICPGGCVATRDSDITQQPHMKNQ